MISSYIEKLIHEGRAACRHYCTGGGAVWRIPIPVNRYIIITDIYYHPFLDSTDKNENFDAINGRRHHQMFFSTSKKNYVLQFRDNFRQSIEPLIPSIVYTPGAVEHRNVYFVFDETVKMNISKIDINSPGTWTNITFALPPVSVSEPNAPVGGAIMPTLQTYNILGRTINPFSEQVLPIGAAFPDVVDQHLADPTALNDPTTTTGVTWNGMNYPLTDLIYYEIFEPLPGCMRGK